MYGYIYLITNKVNGKRYVGMHKSDKVDNWYFGSGTIINRALSKYGRDAFHRSILATSDCREELNDLEKRFIAELNPEYNLTEGGDGGSVKCPLVLKRLSDAAKGHPVTEETRRKISESLKGKRKGVPFSEEHKRKISHSMVGKLKGRTVPSSRKEKISDALKGRTIPDEKKQWGRKLSPESIDKIRKANTGREVSEETKAKMSESARTRKLGKRIGFTRWNDGKSNRLSRECPGPDFTPGWIKK